MNPMTYEQYRLELIATAEAWERGADTAREAKRPDLVRIYQANALRARFLAEPDPELKALFEEAAR